MSWTDSSPAGDSRLGHINGDMLLTTAYRCGPCADAGRRNPAQFCDGSVISLFVVQILVFFRLSLFTPHIIYPTVPGLSKTSQAS